MRKALCISVAVILFAAIGAHSQSAAGNTAKDVSLVTAAYEAAIQKALAKFPDITGIGIVVVKDDKQIFARAYGYADKERGIKADTDTLFYLGSSTKSFTALAAALLDKEGKIKLDSPVTKYTAGINFTNPIPDKVTVRNLLTHTSGLRNSPLTFRLAFSGQSDQATIRRVFGEATVYTETNFGTYRYDNLGYNIYGVLLDNYLKAKWQDVLQSKIFDPLGMKHTTAYASRAQAKKWALAMPYIFDPAFGQTQLSPLLKTDVNMQSAGGIFASVTDLGRWINMNMNGGRLGGKQVIPAGIIESVRTGYTRTTREGPPFAGDGEYGLGWQIGKYRNEKVVYHPGGFTGYFCHISYLPEKKIGVAVVVNQEPVGQPVANLIALYLYDRLLGGDGVGDVDAEFEKNIAQFAERYADLKRQQQAGLADRAKRTWQLSKPFAAYSGRYVSDTLGTIDITAYTTGGAEKLKVVLGNMNAVATPYTQKDTIRVELTPGQGEVIRFNIAADGSIESLAYGDQVFKKM
jgi:CubicO group peptidase (beta-lactamase class C family)